jgi:hypothetical protein
MDRTNKRKAAAGDDPVPAHAIAECAAIPARTNAYTNQALDLLKTKFPRLSVAAIPASVLSWSVRLRHSLANEKKRNRKGLIMSTQIFCKRQLKFAV